MKCAWCLGPLPAGVRSDTKTCSRKCRQAVWRLQQRGGPAAALDGPQRFAYADPPYPGRARRYYDREEVDHRELIAKLEELAPAGWALSTAEDALRVVLPLCPPGARVCPWVKPIAAAPATAGLHNTWEPLIVVRGRQRPPGRRDWLRAQPARHGGELPGRKPLAFCAWLFECLGLVVGDELLDLFPGTGIVTRAWRNLSSRSCADVSSGAAVAQVLNDRCTPSPSEKTHEAARRARARPLPDLRLGPALALAATR